MTEPPRNSFGPLGARAGAFVAIVILSIACLQAAAQNHRVVVATNLPTPLNSSGLRVVDLTNATTFRLPHYTLHTSTPASAADVAADEQIEVQVATGGTSHWLVVGPPCRAEGASCSAPRRLLRGEARLIHRADHDWVTLGPVPAPGESRSIEVTDFFGAPFEFVALTETAATRATSEPRAFVVDASVDQPSPGPRLRYRTTQAQATDLAESFQRLFFFAATSRIVTVTLTIAGFCLGFGWLLLGERRAHGPIFLLVTGVVLLHAALLPPLQGADETSQVGTVEILTWTPETYSSWRFPRSVSLLADALDQDRVQHHPDEPLPLADAHARAAVAALLTSQGPDDAQAPGTPPFGASLQIIDARAPLFYRSFALLGPLLRGWPLGDRVAAYRLVASVLALAAFAAGLWLLARNVPSEQIALVYGLVFLVPYVVAVMASCSNYALAVGVGGVAAAGVLIAALGSSPRERRAGIATLLGAAWLGSTLWPDFILLAVVVGSAVLALAGSSAWKHHRQEARSTQRRRLALGAAAAVVGTAVAVALFWTRLSIFKTPLRFSLLLDLDDPAAGHAFALTVLPTVGAAFVAALVLWTSEWPPMRRRRLARNLSTVLALIILAGFLLTPHTHVPYERTFLPLPALVRAHLESFFSNNLAWSQDPLFWKFYWGVFGWHDTFYPDAVYAAARWSCVALFIALPVLGVSFAGERPRASAALMLVAGIAVSLVVVSELARIRALAHPHGRFLLPWLPLAALPVLVHVTGPGRAPALRAIFRVGVALHIWTAIAVLGRRYLYGA